MTFLPIAVRELRVSSRRRFTFRVRWTTAAAAALLAFTMLAFTDVRPRTAGQFLFSALSMGAFLVAVYSGTLMAADAISRENREQTMGLLFLTDLGGVDIVAGKLLVTGLNALLALTAVLPVLGVAMILGGITGGEFGRAALALLHALMFSLALSLLVSSVQRSHAAAVAWSGGLLTLTVFGAGFLFSLLPVGGAFGWGRWILSGSPWVAFRSAGDAVHRADPDRFWIALAIGQGAVWMMLSMASVLTARCWRDDGEGCRSAGFPGILAAPFGGADRRLSQGLMERNPLLALRSARVGAAPMVWTLAVLGSVIVIVNLGLGRAPLVPYAYSPMTGAAFGLPASSLAVTAILILLKVLFAWQSCEFWSSGRRDGALETLLSTPLTDQQILEAQWTVLRRMFLRPLVLLLTVLMVGSSVQVFLLSLSPGGFADALAAWGLWIYYLVTLPLELMALAWMGAWLALSGARPGQAFGNTVFLVIVLPMLAFCLPSFLVAGLWIDYARNRMSRPLRIILQDAGQTRRWRFPGARPEHLYRSS